jgi:hypothetical protein
MRASFTNTLWGRAAGVAGLGALFFTVGCGATQNAAGVRAQDLTVGQAGTPVVVSCEPHQRTLVRPAIVNGAQVSQVECVAADPSRTYAEAAYGNEVAVRGAMPVSYQPQAVTYRQPAPQVVYDDLEPARVVRTAEPIPVARPRQTRQVVYQEPVKRGRSVKKSAVIIGSSAGIGAAVGAAVKGKKGALIGAAIGGGGAAIWDQVTRRKN